MMLSAWLLSFSQGISLPWSPLVLPEMTFQVSLTPHIKSLFLRHGADDLPASWTQSDSQEGTMSLGT